MDPRQSGGRVARATSAARGSANRAADGGANPRRRRSVGRGRLAALASAGERVRAARAGSLSGQSAPVGGGAMSRWADAFAALSGGADTVDTMRHSDEPPARVSQSVNSVTAAAGAKAPISG